MKADYFYPLFKLDALSGFISLAVGLFFVLTVIYSFGFIRRNRLPYYSYIVLTTLASIAAVMVNNLILLVGLWGFLGLTLYLLINMGAEKSDLAAKKAFIIVGGTDVLMLLGIGIIYYLSGTFQMDAIRLGFDSRLAVLAYLSIAAAAFAKAGAMPFHSWIPDCAKTAPIPMVAFLPAALDKLLGIYLLVRVSLNLFVMNSAMNMFLMSIGAFTIIAAVMMALVQHDMKRLLGYHAVSQVGYMVLGIGTANPIGIAGGIFHMLNNAVYKSCLFFAAGNVECRTRTSELNKLGGLAKAMPITYTAALIASLSIAGVPPFNGFFSKWMIYQGIIQEGIAHRSSLISIICLAAAMFGSALTLASFMKFIHAVFLGQRDEAKAYKRISEAGWQMWLPCVVLAIICVIFGVFADHVPLKYFIFPATAGVSFAGNWQAGLSALLILVGLALGLLFLNVKGLIKPAIRYDEPFVGAETLNLEENRVTGAEFYNTVGDIGILKAIYSKAEAGFFDIYEQGKNIVFGIGRFLQYLHNGVLPTYLVWSLLGMMGLFWALMR